MDEFSKVYIKVDAENRIIALDGGYTVNNITDIDDWILVDEGEGDKYNLCQNNYLPKPLFEEHSIPIYKYVDVVVDEVEVKAIVERTQEEIDADINAIPVVPTSADLLEAQVLYTALMTDTLLEE